MSLKTSLSIQNGCVSVEGGLLATSNFVFLQRKKAVKDTRSSFVQWIENREIGAAVRSGNPSHHNCFRLSAELVSISSICSCGVCSVMVSTGVFLEREFTPLHRNAMCLHLL